MVLLYGRYILDSSAISDGEVGEGGASAARQKAGLTN